jgi:tetratricopeptide (TPR) repeat protein
MKSNFAVLLLLLATAALAQNDWPRPDLTGAGAPVREVVEVAEQRMQALLDSDADPTTRSTAWMALGDVYLAHEFRAEARAAYGRAAELTPRRSELSYRQALVALFAGDQSAALAALEASLSLPHPDVTMPARARRGRILLERDRNDEARAEFERVLQIEPDHPAALAGLGRARLALGDAAGAIESLQRALQLDPGATGLFTPLGQAYRDQGDADAARVAMARAGTGEIGIQDPILDQIQMLSRNPQFFLEAGLAKANRGQFELAAQLIGHALSLSPEDPALLSPYAQVLVEAGADRQARAVFENLAAAGAMAASDHAYLARIEARSGNLEQAEQAYARALLADPALDLARAGRARVWLAQGRFRPAAGAFAELAESIEAPEQRASMEYWLGLARLGDSNCIGALAVLDTAVARLDQPGPVLIEALIRARATCPDVDPGLIEQALEWAEDLYASFPGMESSATLAMAYAAVGRHDDAIELQTQAIFEALKDGTLQARPELQANMQRYRAGQMAERAFAETDPVWSMR